MLANEFKLINLFVLLFCSYRVINDKVSPTLGSHMGLRQAGTIKLNDIIYVEDIE